MKLKLQRKQLKKERSQRKSLSDLRILYPCWKLYQFRRNSHKFLSWSKLNYCNLVFKLCYWNKLLKKLKNNLSLYFWALPFVKKTENSWKTWSKSSISRESNFAICKNDENWREQMFPNSNLEIISILRIWQKPAKFNSRENLCS